MSQIPQGSISFPGIKTILSGTFTLSHGISPSIATVVINPSTNFAVKNGPMVISYGQTQIIFPDCRLDMASLDVGSDGQKWTMRILDRRWKWAFGHITGHYNKLKPDGRTIDIDTEKSPQELATLLLKEMGEKNFEVSQLPNKTRPEATWDYDNPAEQLARLCDSLGCRVVLGLDNKVRLCLLGNGATLPSSRISGGGYGFDPPETPDTLKLVCGPTRYQAKLVLEAVGRDVDGEVRLIGDLTYNPGGVGETNGWANQYPETFQGLITANGLDAKKRALALESVFRWYRIKDIATLDMKIPTFGVIKSIKQLLPLEDSLLDQETPTGESWPQAQHAKVEGVFYDQVGDPKTQVNTARGTRYRGSFSIDKTRGIVQFSDPVYQYVKLESDLKKNDRTTVIAKAGSFAYFPAEIILECSFSILDETKRQPERYTLDRKMANGQFKTGPKITKRDDIYRTVVSRYVSVGDLNRTISDTTSLASVLATAVPYQLQPQAQQVDNEADLKKKANYYLDAEAAKYQPKESLSYSYPYITDISPDGKIHQVSWSVGPNGATTEASQNNEFDLVIPTYAERRLAEIAKLERGEITNQLGSIASTP